jgi:hypothetical protein
MNVSDFTLQQKASDPHRIGMKRPTAAALLVLCASAGCARHDRQGERDRDNSAARRAGHAAYGAAQESKELADKAAKSMWKAGKEAREGWKDAAREHKEEKPDRSRR